MVDDSTGAQTTGSRPKPAFSWTHLKQSLAAIAHVKVYFSLLRGAAAWVDVADEARGTQAVSYTHLRAHETEKAFAVGFGRKVDEASDTMMTVIYSHH